MLQQVSTARELHLCVRPHRRHSQAYSLHLLKSGLAYSATREALELVYSSPSLLQSVLH